MKAWNSFEIYKEILPNFTEIYLNLKKSGVAFPENYEPGYYKYIGDEEKNEDQNYQIKEQNYLIKDKKCQFLSKKLI